MKSLEAAKIKPIKVNSEKFFLIFLISVYLGFVIWSYLTLISPRYAYLGYIANPRSPFIHCISFLLALIPSLGLIKKVDRPSQILIWFIYLLVLLPSLTVPFYATSLSSFELIVYSCVTIAGFWILSFFSQIPHFQKPRFRVPKTVFYIVASILVSAFLYLLVKTFGFSLKWINFLDVYDVRANYKSSLKSAFGIVPYLVIWQGNVINPFLMVYGLSRRKWIWLLVGLVLQLFIYSVTGLKSVSLSFLLVLCIFCGLGTKYKSNNFGTYLLTGASSVILICVFLAKFFNFHLPLSFLVRRLIITPGLLTGFYWDFFATHPKAFLGHSLLKGLVEYPYSKSPPFVIGELYFNNASTSANANFWADSFANFGLSGILIFSILLGIFIWLFDSVSRSIDLRVSSTMLSVTGFSLINSALLTSLVTHGLVLTLIVMACLPTRKLQLSTCSSLVQKNDSNLMSD